MTSFSTYKKYKLLKEKYKKKLKEAKELKEKQTIKKEFFKEEFERMSLDIIWEQIMEEGDELK